MSKPLSRPDFAEYCLRRLGKPVIEINIDDDQVDDRIDEAAVEVNAVLTNGQNIALRVDHAIGSLERPMTDDMLARKFHNQADPVLGSEQVEALIQSCWKLGQAGSVQELVGLARAQR